MKKYFIIIIAILFVAGLLYVYLVPSPVEVEVAIVKRGIFRRSIKTDGILRSKDRYIIPAFGDGDIKRIELKVGDPVKKGAVVAQLYWDTGYLPLKSPIDGVISRVFHESAGPVRRGDQIVEVVNPRNLEIISELLTTDATQVRIGNSVTGEGWGGKDPIRAVVVRISKAGFIKLSALGVEEEKTEIIADLKDPSSEMLEHLGSNFHLDISIEIGTIENALLIPIGAIFRVGQDWAVYKIVNNRARETKIEIKVRGTDEVVIEKGLVENERIINYPGDLVKEGTRIKIK